jgi:hypothetical protein
MEMKLFRKLLIHGSHIIQSISELVPNEKEKLLDIVKKFASIF